MALLCQYTERVGADADKNRPARNDNSSGQAGQQIDAEDREG